MTVENYTQKQLVELCSSKGYNCSYMTIYRAGVKLGFLKRNALEISNQRIQLKLDVDKFNEWLNGVANIPYDCMYIKDAVKKYKIPYNVFKYHFEKHGLSMNSNIYLGYEGLKYAKKSDIESAVQEYTQRIIARKGKRND